MGRLRIEEIVDARRVPHHADHQRPRLVGIRDAVITRVFRAGHSHVLDYRKLEPPRSRTLLQLARHD